LRCKDSAIADHPLYLFGPGALRIHSVPSKKGGVRSVLPHRETPDTGRETLAALSSPLPAMSVRRGPGRVTLFPPPIDIRVYFQQVAVHLIGFSVWSTSPALNTNPYVLSPAKVDGVAVVRSSSFDALLRAQYAGSPI